MSEQRDGATEIGEVIFEFLPMGASIKVSAIHVATQIEVSIVGPENASQIALERNVLAKLRYVLKKKKDESGGGPGIVC